MAFDIYSGTFLRFYTRDWENVVQKQARIDGTKYQMIYAGGDSGPPPAEEVRVAVAAWKDGINAALSQHGLGPFEWSEGDDQPYFTDRPSWQGYAALQLWAAYLERPKMTPPHALPESWAEDPAWQSVSQGETMHFRSIIQGSVWLPGDFDYLFRFPALTEGEVMIGSTGRLLQELRELKSRPLSWTKPSFFSKLKKSEAVSLEEVAKFGVDCFESVVAHGHAAGLPFMLSF